MSARVGYRFHEVLVRFCESDNLMIRIRQDAVDHSNAIDSLHLAIARGDERVWYFGRTPPWAALRNDTRFQVRGGSPSVETTGALPSVPFLAALLNQLAYKS